MAPRRQVSTKESLSISRLQFNVAESFPLKFDANTWRNESVLKKVLLVHYLEHMLPALNEVCCTVKSLKRETQHVPSI